MLYQERTRPSRRSISLARPSTLRWGSTLAAILWDSTTPPVGSMVICGARAILRRLISPARPLAYLGGTFTSIDFPGASSTFAWGINSRGDIVEQYTI